MSPVTTGLLYFALVFAAGFVLGTLRTFVVAPRIDGTTAVLLELPLILGWSWVVAGPLVARLKDQGSTSDRLIMGTLALALLLVFEFILGTWGLMRSAAHKLRAWATAEGLLGLSGQVVFGLLPVVVKRKET